MKKIIDLIFFNRKDIIIVIIMIFIFLSFNLFNNKKEENIVEESIIKEEIDETIVVDIKGEVNSPGSYEIENNKRVKDLIDLAGGLKENACTDNINLSEKLKDEMLVIIPSKEEKEKIETNDTTIKSTDNRISINNASLNELMSINGIGK